MRSAMPCTDPQSYRNYAYYPVFMYDENTEYYIIQNLIGVYGLHEGLISFSLKVNGIATFGKSGKGQIVINGNVYVVEDRGGMANNVIDVFFNSHQEALNFGVKYADVYYAD